MTPHGSLYFIQEGSNGAIKIGWTANPVIKRVASLQLGNSEILCIRGVVHTTADAERAWHAKWRHVQKRSEWFWPDPLLVCAIDDAVSEQRVLRRIAGPAAYSHPAIDRDEVNAWLRDNGVTLAAFSKRIGYNAAYVGNCLRGFGDVSIRMASRIEAETGISAEGLIRGAQPNEHNRKYLDQIDKPSKQKVRA